MKCNFNMNIKKVFRQKKLKLLISISHEYSYENGSSYIIKKSINFPSGVEKLV